MQIQGSWNHARIIAQLATYVPVIMRGCIAIRFGEAIEPNLEKGQSLDFLVLRGTFGEAVKAQGIVIFRRF
jgi:hypothetical protein